MMQIRTYRRPGAILYHADCRAILRELGDHGISVLLTDPPFHGTEFPLRVEHDLHHEVPGEQLGWQQFQAGWTRAWLPPALRLIGPQGLGWLFCSMQHLPVFATVAYTLPWPVRRIWTRPECCGLFLLSEHVLAHQSCLDLAEILLEEPYAPPQQPARLLDLILDLCQPGDIVLDPFLGAQAGFALAARRHGLRVVGIERDEAAFDAAVAALEAV